MLQLTSAQQEAAVATMQLSCPSHHAAQMHFLLQKMPGLPQSLLLNTMSLVARLLAPQDLLLDLLFPGAFDHQTPPQPQQSAVRIYLVDTNLGL